MSISKIGKFVAIFGDFVRGADEDRFHEVQLSHKLFEKGLRSLTQQLKISAAKFGLFFGQW